MKAKKNEPTYHVILTEKNVEILEFIGAYLQNFAENIQNDEEIAEDFESLAQNKNRCGF